MSTIDKTTAEQEFTRWAETMRVDLSREGLDENDRNDTERDKGTIIRALMSGMAIINEKTELVIAPEDPDYSGEPITMHKPKGSAYMAMDRKKATADFGKLYASIADVTGVNAGTFSKLDVADLGVIRAAWSFLMGL